MSSIPKAVLYYSPTSVWSSVALLTLEEKGYAPDEVDLKVVDLAKGENYDPTFLRLNPKATVPALVVPLDKTLSEDVESRYKAITETKTIVEFLDKSRSMLSRTHTTSSAPAPSLTPATIAATMTAMTIIEELLHSDEANPNTLLYANARDDPSLRNLAKAIVPLLKAKQAALSRYISESDSDAIHVSTKVKNLWKDKRSATDTLLDVLSNADKSEQALDAHQKVLRADFYRSAKDAWEVDIRSILTKLNQEAVGPFALGDQFSIADLHLAAWLARLVMLAGGTAADDGNTAIKKLETHIGNGFSLAKDFQGPEAVQRKGSAQSKLAAFWDAVRERPSWKKVYAKGLF